MPRETILIGYLPKRIVDLTGDVDAPRYPGVDEICSVSECISKSPPDWVDCWLHNTDTWLFDSPGAVWWVVPEVERERYRLYAYRLLPTLFHESGKETGLTLPEIKAVPIPASFIRIGYDAVVHLTEYLRQARRLIGETEDEPDSPLSFGCSPLSCNYMAEEYPVNRYCLVDDPDTALAMARDFASGNCEPGPYCVVEVWAQGPKRRGEARLGSAGEALFRRPLTRKS
jgi:hypothetical protein